MMREPERDTDVDGVIRRLNDRANHLDHVGQHEEAADLRFAARALSAAEVQRLTAVSDAHTQVTRLMGRLRYAWETIDPRDSFNWFIEHSDDPEVIELCVELKRQNARILILEAARA